MLLSCEKASSSASVCAYCFRRWSSHWCAQTVRTFSYSSSGIRMWHSQSPAVEMSYVCFLFAARLYRTLPYHLPSLSTTVSVFQFGLNDCPLKAGKEAVSAFM